MALESSLRVRFARGIYPDEDKLSSKSRSRSRTFGSVFGRTGNLAAYVCGLPTGISIPHSSGISDRFRLQFRAEAFNHANFPVGDNTSLRDLIFGIGAPIHI